MGTTAGAAWGQRTMLRRIPLLIALAVLVAAVGVAKDTKQANADTVFYGQRKGVVWLGGQQHHYVEATVNFCARNGWRVEGPLWPSTWGATGCQGTIRAYYSWPYGWWDPYPASSWRFYAY